MEHFLDHTLFHRKARGHAADLELPEEVTLVPFSAEKGLGRDELVKIILGAVKNV